MDPVEHGQPGELVLRHTAAAPRKGFFSGYLKNEAATGTAWRNGWFHTGDQVTRDASGMFYFLDRTKNIIRRPGETIAATEVDECLVAHPKVKQVAVLAVADDLREEEVMACIVPEEDAIAGPDLAREPFDRCNERLAYFKVRHGGCSGRTCWSPPRSACTRYKSSRPGSIRASNQMSSTSEA